MMRPFERMPMNEVVVEELEKLLARAKEGRMNWIGYAFCEGAMAGCNNFTGDMASFYSGYYGLHRCASQLMERMSAFQIPPSDLTKPANLYRYGVTEQPVAHDFIGWLVGVKMLQAREKVAGPTKICFMHNPNALFSDAAYRAVFWKTVMKPALELFDCEMSPEAKDGRTSDEHHYRPIVEAARNGEAVPRITPPPAVMQDMKTNLAGIEPVTITLREHHHWTHRNSDLAEWLKFAKLLEGYGEHVIFVRDYAHAEEEIDGFDTMPAASTDFLVRAALYEHAKCNMFVSNGPATLALFGSRPWLQFIVCKEGEEYPQNTPQWWWLNHGITPGEQFPWCEKTQRIIWEADTYPAMVRAWNDLMPLLAKEAARAA